MREELLRAAGRGPPRAIPGERAWRTALRTAHLIAFGALYGGQVYGASAERLLPALVATVATGGALMGFEIYRSPLWLVQVRGVATLVKIALVAGTAAWGKMQVEIFTLAIGIGAVTAHMPGRSSLRRSISMFPHMERRSLYGRPRPSVKAFAASGVNASTTAPCPLRKVASPRC